MDAAIGRLHLSITVKETRQRESQAPKVEESSLATARHWERILRRERALREAEADRTFWTASHLSRGRF
jgi:hypothetical protein